MSRYIGLTDEEVLENRLKGGENLITPPKPIPWYKLYLEKYKDPIIIILLVATLISLIVGAYRGTYVESLSIIMAILLATGISFWMEYGSKKKFEALKQFSDNDPVIVFRGGGLKKIKKRELVVGDIIQVKGGDDVPADIVLLEAYQVSVNEATMTGESMPNEKEAIDEDSGEEPKDINILLRGTSIVSGNGVGRVIRVGDSTDLGKLHKIATEDKPMTTYLTKDLEILGKRIGKVVMIIAGLSFIILNIRYFITSYDTLTIPGIIGEEINYLMIALALIIAGVPEGLGTSITVSLAYAMKSMMKDNNLVKTLHACEILGYTTHILTDKTGTLTQAKLEVVDSDIKSQNLFWGACINSTAGIDDKGNVVGDPTEGAILKFTKETGNLDYQEIRKNSLIIRQKPFDSTWKYMATESIYLLEDSKVYVKGAPEIIGKLVKNIDQAEIEEQQKRGRRAISFASGPDLDSLVYDGSLFLEDPLRPGIKESIQECYKAGIEVIMLTGDNGLTANEIATQAGMLKQDNSNYQDIWTLDAKDFKKYAWGDPNCGYPNVVSRCTPNDKVKICEEFKVYRNGGHTPVIAATGDGVNDIGLLRRADIGLAMGGGTDAAKDVADIVLLDNSFSSIVSGIKWGRSLYKNIQSFLAGQLSINLAVCLTTMISPLVGMEIPFTVIDLLWINIIMDTVMALSVSTEGLDPNVMKDKPREPRKSILANGVLEYVIEMGLMIGIFMTFLIVDTKRWGGQGFGMTETGIIATFLMLCTFGTFNVRVVGRNKSIFSGLGKNKWFLVGILIMFLGSVLLVTLEHEPLSVKEWIKVIGVSTLPCLFYEIEGRLRRKRTI